MQLGTEVSWEPDQPPPEDQTPQHLPLQLLSGHRALQSFCPDPHSCGGWSGGNHVPSDLELGDQRTTALLEQLPARVSARVRHHDRSASILRRLRPAL
eukprot:1770580-Rhodomonas_salina.2